MLITAHWSATGPTRLNDYHVEFAGSVPENMNTQLGKIDDPTKIDWSLLTKSFTFYKNVNFDIATDYGTWHLNHDPEDNSANIEIGALTMGGEGVSVAGSWGKWPYTYAHGWIHAGIIARICKLKSIDPLSEFKDGALQNGPFYRISTHAERAIQTPDSPAANLRPSYGYFIYSGDSDCRWDISVRDPSEAKILATPAVALAAAKKNAAWFRTQAANILKMGVEDFWGLDKPA